jgi:Zn-dependent M28 family amino/carboxypeptidase
MRNRPLSVLRAALVFVVPACGAVMASPTPAAPASVRTVAPILAEVSPARLRATVDRLVAFGTRHTASVTDDPARGIGAARRWLKEEMERAAADSGRTGADAVRVSFDSHVEPKGARLVRDTEIVNVVAEIPGSMPEAAARRYYFIAHYDSRCTDPNDAVGDAPGANDCGSGTAAVVELVRVLAKHRFDATLVLVAVAGEEQGLYGSKALAKAARENGLDVRAVLSDDMVGDPSGAPAGAPLTIRVFSEGIPANATPEDAKRIRALGGETDSTSRELARYVAEVAALQTTRVRPVLVARPDRFLRGGDHLSFNEQGFAAVRFTDAVEKYTRQHQDVREEKGVRYGDLPEFVDADALAEVARLNAAVLAHLANAPSSPGRVRIVAAELATDTTLRWSASPEPDTAGYEVVWRETTSAGWQHVQDAGAVTEVTLPLCKDDFLFGVRAYDRDGFRSPVSFAGAGKE